MIRWILTDPVTLATWTMPINPDQMTSPHPRKDLTHTRGAGDADAVSMKAPAQPVDWSWSGVIRSQAHYDVLLVWARKTYPIKVTDHLGRTWLVVIKKFTPAERRPTAVTALRMRYTVQTLNLGETP